MLENGTKNLRTYSLVKKCFSSHLVELSSRYFIAPYIPSTTGQDSLAGSHSFTWPLGKQMPITEYKIDGWKGQSLAI